MTPVAPQILRWSILQLGATPQDYGTDEKRAREVFEAAKVRARTNGGTAQLFWGATLLESFDVPDPMGAK